MRLAPRFRSGPAPAGWRNALARTLGRPVIACLVFGIGVLCLVLVPLIHSYVLPRVEVAPIDADVTDVSTGPGTYFDSHTLKTVGPVPLTVTRHLVGDVAASRANGVAVWNVSTRVDTQQTVGWNDPRLSLSWTVERWVFDRHTARPVHCCGESPRFDGNAYLKFPFDLTKGRYDYWDANAKRAFPVRFAGERTVQGHLLYRFDGTVPPTRTTGIDVPGSLVGMPDHQGLVHVDEYFRDDGTEVLVDPMSGVPVTGSQHPRITLRLPGGHTDLATVFSANFTSTPASVTTVLSVVDGADARLRLVENTLPDICLLTGSICTAIGVVLLIAGAVRTVRVHRLREAVA
jgi:hypothetical protein